jgi:hypothetical protein
MPRNMERNMSSHPTPRATRWWLVAGALAALLPALPGSAADALRVRATRDDWATA